MKISLHWPLPFLDPLLEPLTSSDQSGKARATTVLSHMEGRRDATQQESRTAARTGSADKLYLINSVCFCFILHLHSIGRGLYSNALEGTWDCDPNMRGSAWVHSEAQLSSAPAVWTTQQNWLTCVMGVRTLSNTPTLILHLVVVFFFFFFNPLLRFWWGSCFFHTVKLRGSIVNKLLRTLNIANQSLNILLPLILAIRPQY